MWGGVKGAKGAAERKWHLCTEPGGWAGARRRCGEDGDGDGDEAFGSHGFPARPPFRASCTTRGRPRCRPAGGGAANPRFLNASGGGGGTRRGWAPAPRQGAAGAREPTLSGAGAGAEPVPYGSRRHCCSVGSAGHVAAAVSRASLRFPFPLLSTATALWACDVGPSRKIWILNCRPVSSPRAGVDPCFKNQADVFSCEPWQRDCCATIVLSLFSPLLLLLLKFLLTPKQDTAVNLL